MRSFLEKYVFFTPLNFWVLFLIIFPYLIILNHLLLGESYWQRPLFFIVTPIAFMFGAMSSVLHVFATNLLRYNMSGYAQLRKRVIVQLLTYLILTVFGELAMLGGYIQLNFLTFPIPWGQIRAVFFTGVIMDIIALCFSEGAYAFTKWRESTIEAERLKNNFLQSQLEGLKNQVNPHFLFNSLNTLSALIYTNQEKAGKFLDEMSKVYRYLLTSNENDLIPLKTELQFMHSFFHMLKNRFQEGISLELNIRDEHLDYLIPPLTLQMLVENAVKHNVIAEESPLRIEIATDENDILVIRNNIQKKTTKVFSNGIGLKNIIAKYQLLSQAHVEVIADGSHFIVQLPLFLNHKHI